MSASFESSENCSCPEEIVKNEALLNCQDKRWCSFLCMLALSSVTSANIFSHYPDCGEERDKLFFNCKVEPRKLLRSVHDVHILFWFQGYIQTGNFFKPNHCATSCLEMW